MKTAIEYCNENGHDNKDETTMSDDDLDDYDDSVQSLAHYLFFMNAGLASVIQMMASAIHLRINAGCPVEFSTGYRRYYMAARGYANFIF